MSQALLDKMRAARQRSVEVAGHHYTIRRPTPMDAMEWLGNLDAETTQAWFKDNFNLKSESWRQCAWYAVLHFVDGWDLKEIDLIAGGTPESIAFSLEVFEEYLRENPVVLNGLAVDIFTLWLVHLQNVESDEKKPAAGLVDKASEGSPEA